MQLTTLFLAALATAGTTLAAPTPADKSMMATGSTWTMQNFQRTCGPLLKQCTYSYSINTNDGTATTACTYQVNSSDPSATPAAKTTYENVKCGAFMIGSTWSGQFGANQGFQTLSVVKGSQIIYPAYTDAQLAAGSVVKPDQSYTPQNLP